MAIISVTGMVGFFDFSYSSGNGTPVLTLSIADKRYDFKKEEEETVWIRAVWFGDRAEKLSSSLSKAKMVSITGKENYTLYDGKINRTIDPIDHQILLFKPNEDQSKMGSNQPDQTPPFLDDDIPFL